MPGEAILQTLRHVWRTIEPLDLPTALIGGIALSAWKHVRATRDIDFIVGMDAAAFEPVMQSLIAADLRPKHSPPVVELGRFKLAQFLYSPDDALMDVQIDLLLADSAYHREALSRRVTMKLPDAELEIAVLACEDLVLHKLMAGRMIDLADAAALLRANCETIDNAYLDHWAGKLLLEKELAAARKDAFS
jgi:hypothetical protein